MTDTETAQVQQIREREQQATPGPWYVDRPRVVYRIRTIEGIFILEGNSFGVRLDDDADFIAHARTDIPLLLALVTRQQAEIDRLRGERDELKDLHERALCATSDGINKQAAEDHLVERLARQSAESSLSALREALKEAVAYIRTDGALSDEIGRMEFADHLAKSLELK